MDRYLISYGMRSVTRRQSRGGCCFNRQWQCASLLPLFNIPFSSFLSLLSLQQQDSCISRKAIGQTGSRRLRSGIRPLLALEKFPKFKLPLPIPRAQSSEETIVRCFPLGRHKEGFEELPTPQVEGSVLIVHPATDATPRLLRSPASSHRR